MFGKLRPAIVGLAKMDERTRTPSPPTFPVRHTYPAALVSAGNRRITARGALPGLMTSGSVLASSGSGGTQLLTGLPRHVLRPPPDCVTNRKSLYGPLPWN